MVAAVWCVQHASLWCLYLPVPAGVQHIQRRPCIQDGLYGRDEVHLHAGHADFVDVRVALQHAGQRLDQHCAADDRLIVLSARLRLAVFEKKAGRFVSRAPMLQQVLRFGSDARCAWQCCHESSGRGSQTELSAPSMQLQQGAHPRGLMNSLASRSPLAKVS